MEDTSQKNWTLGSKDTNYKTSYDPDLLVRIDRYSKRQDFYQPTFGYDLWTCYEVSFLLPSGLPEFEVMKIYVDSNSPYIFESKSLKLYLFSLNNTVFESKEVVMKTIEEDLTKVTGLDTMGMKVFIQLVSKMAPPPYFYRPEVVLEYLHPACECKEYNVNSNLLQIEEVKEDRVFFYSSNLLRSNCPITNQPDWGLFNLTYQTNNKISINEESLLKYIVSYRNHQAFHEITCESENAVSSTIPISWLR